MKIRPEIKDWKYWLHLLLIAFIVLHLTKFINASDMTVTVRLILELAIYIGIADIIVHTLLGLD